MIKVIELIPTLSMGGAETMIKDYCLLMDSKNIEIQVVVFDRKYNTVNEQIIENSNVRVYYLGNMMYGKKDKLNFVQKIIRAVSRYIYWRKILLREKPDIIHIHLHVGAYIRFVPNSLKCKLILTVHNVIDNYFSKEKKIRDKYQEYKEVNRLIHKKDMKLIALHEDMAIELKEYFNTNNVAVVHNGIIIDRFQKSLYNRNTIRQSLGINDSTYVIGNVASMSPQKNHKLILDVFAMISKTHKNVKLLLVGSGKLKTYIEKRIEEEMLSDKVIMLSNRKDIPELMSVMDVFFLPSNWEGFGNVMIEAQSMGLRCVVSDKVPSYTRVTDRVSVCELHSECEVWMEALLDGQYPTLEKKSDIATYDMKNSVKNLEKIYIELVKNDK